MSAITENISEEDVENHPPSTLLYTNGSFLANDANSSKVKRSDFLKQRGRRKKWWYLNRGLQPIYEAGESKDDPTESCTAVSDNISRDEYLNIKNNSLKIDEISSGIIITNNTNQTKESYSPCLRVIEKFQEIVMDSAVRVIQAAFKRFRERRRFLRIKKAVMVIQRNLRKWIQARHPCLRPAEFDMQSSDSAKSDEYRETENHSESKILADRDDNYCIVQSESLLKSNKIESHMLNLDERKGTVCTSRDTCESSLSEYGTVSLHEHVNDIMEIGKDDTNITSTDSSIHFNLDCGTVSLQECEDDIMEISKDNTNTTSTDSSIHLNLDCGTVSLQECEDDIMEISKDNTNTTSTDSSIDHNSECGTVSLQDCEDDFMEISKDNTNTTSTDSSINHKHCCIETDNKLNAYKQDEDNQCNKEIQLLHSSLSDGVIPNTSNLETPSKHAKFNNMSNNIIKINKERLLEQSTKYE